MASNNGVLGAHCGNEICVTVVHHVEHIKAISMGAEEARIGNKSIEDAFGGKCSSP
jgi:hypothetical protein